jgi:hypothetical protein
MTDETQPGAEPSSDTDVTDEGDARVMGLLSEHVPLSLLVDLADPEGPASDEILQSEGKPDDAWWVQEGSDGTGDGSIDGAGDAAGDPAGEGAAADEAQQAPSDRA